MTQEHSENAEGGAHEPLRVLEAMLFASAEPLTMNAMRERLPDNADVGGMLMQLQQTYEGRGVHLLDLDGSWAFRTASDLGAALQINRDVQRKLSRAAMETLAIVAYHQPVTRSEIENIRGIIAHKGTLDVLMECGWVKPGKRRETPGRPLTWVTTTSFLDHFGLEALTDLPGLDELKASGLLDRRPAIEALDTGDLFALEDDAESDDEDDAEDDDAYEDEDDEGGAEKAVSVAPVAAEADAEDEDSEDEDSEEDDESDEDDESEDEDEDDEDFDDDDEDDEDEGDE